MGTQRQYDLVAVFESDRVAWQHIDDIDPREVFGVLVLLENEFDCECFCRMDGEYINLNDEVPLRGGHAASLNMYNRKTQISTRKPAPC